VQKNGAALVSGDITASDWTLLTWDGSNYQILNIIDQFTGDAGKQYCADPAGPEVNL